MPLYEFDDIRTGERVEINLPFSKAPSIGSTVKINGRTLVRAVSRPGSIVNVDAGCETLSDQFPRGFGKKATKDGRARFEGGQDVRETLAEAADHGMRVEWNGTLPKRKLGGR